jgi:GNAT superfamily N-acetyltransferase
MRAFTLAQRPDLNIEFEKLDERLWPEFMLHGDMNNPDDYSKFDEYQFAYINESGQVIAGGQTIPFHWSGVTEELPETLDEVMQNALANREATVAVSAPGTQQLNYLCAVAALVDEPARGQGMSRAILLEMKKLARRHGLFGVVAPVRPTLKSEHPEVSIEKYANWRREDGQLYDPWLRVHEQLGGKRLGIAPRAFSVIASVADWQRWTGVAFDHTGAHMVPGALVPVEIDFESDTGTYVEPSVWYLHSLS